MLLTVVALATVAASAAFAVGLLAQRAMPALGLPDVWLGHPLYMPWFFWGMVAFAFVLAAPGILLVFRRIEKRSDLEAIAGAGGVDAERLVELVAQGNGPRTEPDHFPLPASDGDVEPLFSRSLRSRMSGRIYLVRLLALVLVPVAAVALIQALPLSGGALAVALAVAVAATLAVGLAIDNGISLAGYPQVRRQLAQRLAAEGVALPPEAVFVGLSPHAEPRFYETHFDWDVGFLVASGDALTYFGDRTRFAVAREELTALELVPVPGSWWRSWRLAPRWRQEDGDQAASLAAVAGTLYATQQATFELRQRLVQWREAATAETPPGLPQLPAASFPEVASRPLEELMNPIGLIVAGFFLFGLTALVSVACGLSPIPAEGGGAWLAPSVAVASTWLGYLPWIRDRRRGRSHDGDSE